MRKSYKDWDWSMLGDSLGLVQMWDIFRHIQTYSQQKCPPSLTQLLISKWYKCLSVGEDLSLSLPIAGFSLLQRESSKNKVHHLDAGKGANYCKYLFSPWYLPSLMLKLSCGWLAHLWLYYNMMIKVWFHIKWVYLKISRCWHLNPLNQW